MSFTSSSAPAGASHSPEDKFHPLPLTIAGVDSSSPSSSSVPGNSMTQAVHFSSGNPRIEETRGVMHLFPDHGVSSSSSSTDLFPVLLAVTLTLHFILYFYSLVKLRGYSRNIWTFRSQLYFCLLNYYYFFGATQAEKLSFFNSYLEEMISEDIQNYFFNSRSKSFRDTCIRRFSWITGDFVKYDLH